MKREASFRTVAAALGMSPKTVAKVEAEALAKLRAGLAAHAADADDAELTPLERAMLRAVADSYCARLMSCRPHEEPDGDPPRLV